MSNESNPEVVVQPELFDEAGEPRIKYEELPVGEQLLPEGWKPGDALPEFVADHTLALPNMSVGGTTPVKRAEATRVEVDKLPLRARAARFIGKWVSKTENYFGAPIGLRDEEFGHIRSGRANAARRSPVLSAEEQAAADARVAHRVGNPWTVLKGNGTHSTAATQAAAPHIKYI